ncbi:TetR family transcriptional regulator [Paenibacillus sp. JX-17]|uniref:TetR family transcriptional regulator n=1 Tax=Paenibacillus lacisoli TaxID=3064525 RepID=A0ABT9CHI8_9BACL|nr:TetR family transcriptional regulator [Paenibacillus sp. JX-17]MDO7908736.1 TetR family transcriptional regulator [Paenibacillus sp. JX-17]
MIQKHSLRDIKKEATAHALADASYELALERGLDGFIVDDVVQKAGYSRRTFANHYSCKEEAVAAAAVSFQGTDAQEAERILSEVNADTEPLDIFYRLMRTQLVTEHIGKMRDLVSLSKRYPTLEPFILSAFHQLQISAQQMVSMALNGRYPEAYTHLLAGAVYGSITPLLDGSVKVLINGETAGDETEALTFDQYLETMFNYLRNGF